MGHFSLLMLLFDCGGSHELCALYIHSSGIQVLSLTLAVLLALVIPSEVFLSVLRLASSNKILVLGVLVCHSNDSSH